MVYDLIATMLLFIGVLAAILLLLKILKIGNLEIDTMGICPNCKQMHNDWEYVTTDKCRGVCRCKNCGWIGVPLYDE